MAKLGPAMPSMPVKEPKPKSRVSFSFHKKHGAMMPPGVKVGKKHQLSVAGTVTGMRSDEYGHSLDMDLAGAPTPLNQSTEPDADDMPSSLTRALRKRHSQTGRFTA